MAFSFRSRATIASSNTKQSTNGGLSDDIGVIPKLTNAQLNQLAKLYPPWLNNNVALKQLPGIYQGVLGQVQLQPGIEGIERKFIGKQEKPTDYMNKFTDTERVHQLLSASQLPNETLATIWAHVNKTFPGKLTNREVCLALALIGIFQRLDKEASSGGSHFSPSSKDKDPFNIVRVEKRPPVPTLHPTRSTRNNNGNNNNNNNNDNGTSIKGIVQSKSTPENLGSSKDLLVDIFGDQSPSPASSELPEQANFDDTDCTWESDLDKRIKDVVLNNPMSLMDLDSDKFEIDFNATTRTWFKFLSSIKSIFKRSFDILNVENSRKSAIEALRSPRGQDFGRNLSLCYPLAHNIKHRIDQLNSIRLATDEHRQNSNKTTQQSSTRGVFNKKYTLQIDDLMTSINEYWAVLINLLHESGQTEFIELIMDGLIMQDRSRLAHASASIDDIAMEFSPRSDICSICHSRYYLKPDYDLASRQLVSKLADLVEAEDLISDDGQHYYHPRCASFWLNQVDATGLPFFTELQSQTILSPALLD